VRIQTPHSWYSVWPGGDVGIALRRMVLLSTRPYNSPLIWLRIAVRGQTPHSWYGVQSGGDVGNTIGIPTIPTLHHTLVIDAVVLCGSLVHTAQQPTVLDRIELHRTQESWQNTTWSDKRCWKQVTIHDADGVITKPNVTLSHERYPVAHWNTNTVVADQGRCQRADMISTGQYRVQPDGDIGTTVCVSRISV